MVVEAGGAEEYASDDGRRGSVSESHQPWHSDSTISRIDGRGPPPGWHKGCS